MRTRKHRAAIVATALAALAGCQGATDTNGGLTNGPPPTTSREKAAMRSDLPVTPAPAHGEALGETGDANTNAGIAGTRSGANEPGKSDSPSASGTDRATPPAKGSTDPGSAAGGTKPAETIHTGTPKSPQ